MILSEILTKVKPINIVGTTEINVTGINIDSRKIKAGDMFIAVKGTQADGHNYISKALELGVKVIVCEDLPSEMEKDVTYVQLDDTEDATGKLATQFYDNPTTKLKLIGVTGTNGKTTIATLLFKLFRKFGHKCGLCSTVCNYIEDTAYPTSQTTPDPITLNCLLAKMVKEGCEYAFMECSSHAIQQKRIGGLTFAGALFTNLTRDHLDYHKTFEAYRDAKKMFFDNLDKNAFAITNADDKNGLIMTQNTKANIKTYSQCKMADFHAKIIEMDFNGMLLDINGTEVHIPLVGKFNVSNILAIYGATMMLGKDHMETLTILSSITSVSGRFETVHTAKGQIAIIDYAHTPDALENVLNTIQNVLRNNPRNTNQIFTICGAGGNRDKGKRPQMANIAAKYSDKVIITSDNPRFEEPQDIINDMLAGLDDEQKKNVLSIVDRREAIRTALMLANSGDVILIAGKGHENYQEIKGVKHHFDDKEEVLKN
ncbi:MAG: UDP-N-acetylmuramoyl-L-alanyl-D-glutamate--2,6-diaminopimelate ligase [Prevotellaceae bacterium]|nr:UDP-N-acetylmuramoyl-L-alanyl-D-glutamate--2,6-diaminopimelate ligase [Candidatus Faecinaster equi]